MKNLKANRKSQIANELTCDRDEGTSYPSNGLM